VLIVILRAAERAVEGTSIPAAAFESAVFVIAAAQTVAVHGQPKPLTLPQGARPHMLADNDLQLVRASRDHVLQMMEWFADQRSCALWGGWAFRFPFTAETFLADSKLGEIPSYALIRDPAQLCGFGQFYLRAARCHLAHLAVAPALRGRGLGTELIKRLLSTGKCQLHVTESSLFVHSTNAAAMALYERLGFKRVAYPEEGFDRPDIYYMIARLP
jgi:ribosomal protein S18 acetylase RimI-like enzyme